MDPISDLPPSPEKPTADVSATSAAIPTSAPSPAPARNHPPYAEMISAAISALGEQNGSTKNAIAKYIESNFTDLPSTHAALLTHHLKQLKISGQLLMVKHSYQLPRSAPAPADNGAVNSVSSDPVTKRRPGRPPKPKPDSVQVAVPVFQPPIDINAVPAVAQTAEPQQSADVGPVNGSAAAAGPPVRGRGRPPKQIGLKRGVGRPPKSGGVRRGRGRPKVLAPVVLGRKGPGRPPKLTNVVQGFAPVGAATEAVGVGVPAVGGGVAPLERKRRGRPPRAGAEVKRQRIVNAVQPKKPRKLSGKALGRPKKNAPAAIVNRSPDSQLLVAYLDLKSKLENLQLRISQTADVIKPTLNNEASISALQELELTAMNLTTSPVAQNQQPPPEQYPQQPQS